MKFSLLHNFSWIKFTFQDEFSFVACLPKSILMKEKLQSIVECSIHEVKFTMQEINLMEKFEVWWCEKKWEKQVAGRLLKLIKKSQEIEASKMNSKPALTPQNSSKVIHQHMINELISEGISNVKKSDQKKSVHYCEEERREKLSLKKFRKSFSVFPLSPFHIQHLSQ